MHKKMFLVAAMVVAATAFSIPSVASAVEQESNWTKHTQTAAGEENVTFTATDPRFAGGIGGTTCANAHSNTTLTPGSTGDVNSFTVASPTTECTTSGLLAGCKVTKVESTTPWIAHNTTTNIHITNVKIHNYMHGAFCPYAKLTLKGDITVTPTDSLTHVSTGHISGTLKVYDSSTNQVSTVTASGELHAVPAGTYGLH